MNIEHVDELLSGYLDGELTQQDRQRVELHCESCSECAAALQELARVRERVAGARLSTIGEDTWRETMNDSVVKGSRAIGWLIFLAALLAGAGFFVVSFIMDDSLGLYEKLIAGGIYGGLLLLFLSVLRQRLIERRTDKYKDVEI